MNHPDPPQPDPNDRAQDAPRSADGRHRGADSFQQIISSAEGQLEQLNRVRSEMDEQTLSLGEHARDLAAQGMQPPPLTPSGEPDTASGRQALAFTTLKAGLEDKIREAKEHFSRLVGEQEAFDEERERWVAGREAAEEKLQEREEELAQQERDFTEEREQLAEIAARVAEERARDLKKTQGEQEAGAHLAALTAQCAELETRLTTERERAERAEAEGIELARDIEQERDEALAERDTLEQRLAVVDQQRLETQPSASAETKVASDVRVRAMQQKITKLEGLLAAKYSEAGLHSPEMQQKQLDDLRSKAQRLSSVSDHLRRRHYRLRQLRHLLKKKQPRAFKAGPDPKRAAEAAEQHAAQVRELESRRIAIGEKAATLADAERRMIRRWARARAVVIVGWIVMVGVVSAAASWIAACQIAPPLRSASITIDARARSRAALTDEQAAAWRAWHTAIVADDTYLESLAKRMDERQIEAYADPAQIDQRLARDLTFSTVDNDTLMLTLSGTDPDEIITILDLATTALVVESGRVLRKRTAEAWATLGGAEVQLNPTPITDQRLPWAGGLFGGLYLVLILSGVVLYKRLIRVRDELDADGTLFTDLAPMSDGAVQKVAVIGGP